MEKTFALVTVFCLMFSSTALPVGNLFAGARALALSDAVVAVPDAWSVFHNQAGLASFSGFSAGVFYQSEYGLKELSSGAASVIFPVDAGVFGFSFLQFGQHSFKGQSLNLAYAKKLSAKISAGICFSYFSRLMPENRRPNGFATFAGGLLYNPVENLVLGAHLFNPLQQGLKTVSGKIKYPSVLRVGGSLKFSEELMSCAELFRAFGGNTALRCGIEYCPAGKMFFRFGVSGKPFAYSSGFGCRFGKITSDIGFSYHDLLGLTPSVSIQFALP